MHDLPVSHNVRQAGKVCLLKEAFSSRMGNFRFYARSYENRYATFGLGFARMSGLFHVPVCMRQSMSNQAVQSTSTSMKGKERGLISDAGGRGTCMSHVWKHGVHTVAVIFTAIA